MRFGINLSENRGTFYVCAKTLQMHQKIDIKRHIFQLQIHNFYYFQPFSVLTLSFVINLTGIKMVELLGFFPFKMSLPT